MSEMAGFKPCAVIPVYNHHQQLPTVIDSLKQQGLHCIIINDGSDEATRLALIALAEHTSSISLFHLSWNQGKGAAVMEGLIRAKAAGFTHALQIDADGQHDTNALPSLLSMAEQHPDALISGVPTYDESVPKSRLYGRKITRFWVSVETLSLSSADTMVGFRVYPIAATCQLINTIDMTRRMDFDIEIAVRLNWEGIAVKTVPVHVSYPEDGISHFDPFKDNVRISALHTRLFFGMLYRLPRLIKRRGKQHSYVQNNAQSSRHWSSIQERGSEWGIRFLLTVYRLLGHTAFSLLLLPVMTYYFLSGRQARQASVAYLKRVYQSGSTSLPEPPGRKQSFTHFMAFGQALADRFAAWSGQISLDHLDIHGQEQLEQALSKNKGVIFLVSHLGNSELCRALADIKKDGTPLKVNVLVHTRHAPAFNKVMSDINPASNVRLIQVDTIGPDTSILLSECLERGEMVAIAADRAPDNTTRATSAAHFLGDSALFPKGPFILASVLRSPVFTLFCTRQGKGRYRLDIAPFADPLLLPRKTREDTLSDYIQQYAERLESACQRSPLEWFNFFDFWRSSGVSK